MSFGCLRMISFSGATPPSSINTRAKRSASETAYCRRGRSAPPEFAPTTSVNRWTVAAASALSAPGTAASVSARQTCDARRRAGIRDDRDVNFTV